MILGRSTVLWLGLVAALLNVAVLVFGVALSPEQVIALNAAAFAIVGLIANESDPRTVSTFALTTTAPATTVSTPAVPATSITTPTPTATDSTATPPTS